MALVRPLTAVAQCTGIQLTYPAAVCKSENIRFVNTTPSIAEFKWDFCPGDLMRTPTALPHGPVPGGVPFDIDVVTDQGNYYGFTLNNSPAGVTRLDFGNDLQNIPTTTSIGNPGGLMGGTTSIRIVKQGNNWFGLVYSLSNRSIVLLSFGTSPQNASPTASIIATSVGAAEGAIDVVEVSPNNFVVLLSEFGGTVTAIAFANGLDQPSTSMNVTNVGGYLVDVKIIKNCSSWVAFLLRYDTKTIIRLEFGGDLMTTPTVTNYPSNLFGFGPYRMWMEFEGDFLYGLVANISGGVATLSIGTALTNPAPTVIDHGDLTVLNSTWSIFGVKQGDHWLGLTLNAQNSVFYLLDFPNPNCQASVSSFTGTDPGLIAFNQAGQYYPSVIARYTNGSIETESLAITVQSAQATPLTISAQATQCLGTPQVFSPVSSATLTGIAWDFGDGTSSAATTPSHAYASPGQFNTYLVASDGTCTNRAVSNITNYAMPVPDFIVPSPTLACTGQSFTFTNNSGIPVGVIPTYSWTVDAVQTSSSTDLIYMFSGTGTHQVDLTASYFGCTNHIAKNFSVQQVGPQVGFSLADNCQGVSTQLTNTSTGTGITGYQWTFGNGGTSTQASPQYTYPAAGVFDVTLTVSNSVGCNNFLTKKMHVWSSPQPDFAIGAPPFSCATIATPFQNITPPPSDSNVASWQWQFGDGPGSTSNQQTPTHIYASNGSYNVTLTAITDRSCSASITKPIAISASPIANFAMTAACLNLPTNFIDISSGNVTSRNWQIGPASFTSSNPSYTFTAPGTYAATLTVGSANGCTTVKTVNVTVSTTPVLNFTAENLCAGKDARFADATSSPQDAIVGWNWNFDGNSSTGNPASFNFAMSGTYNVKLTTTHTSGCKYTLSRNYSVNSSPVADFSASPDRGEPPLTVQFTNKSQQATSFAWKFNDKVTSTSIVASPLYTFTSLGNYSAELTVMNASGCSDVLTKPIIVLVPSIDLVLTNFSLVSDPQTGKLRGAVVIRNDSNIPVSYADVSIVLSDRGSVNETLQIDLAPGQSISKTLSFTIVPGTYDFLCADIASEKDVKPDNNKQCVNFENRDYFFVPYPNPVSTLLNVDWMSHVAGTTTITIIDAVGKKVQEYKLPAIAGLNRATVDVSLHQAGLYYVVIDTGSSKKTMRILHQ